LISPAVASRAISGRSLTRVLGRLLGMVRAWIAIAVVLHPLVPDLGMIHVRLDLEGHVVAEIETPGGLKSLKYVVGRAHHTKVDIFGGPSPDEAHFENQPALERHRVTNDRDDAREEPIEDEQLATAREVGTGGRRGLDPLLERLLERERRCVAPNHRALSDVRSRAALSSAPSFSEMSPRRRAWSTAWRTSSGETFAFRQSRRVLCVDVIGTAENPVRSDSLRSA